MANELRRLRKAVHAARVYVAWEIHLHLDGKCAQNILVWKYRCINAIC